MADHLGLMAGSGAHADLAAAVLNNMEPIFSIPIYLMTIFLPRFQHILAGRPWIRKLLSIVLAVGVAASFVIRFVHRLWGESLWNSFLYWSTSAVYVNWDDTSLHNALLCVYYTSELLLPTNECVVRTIQNSKNIRAEDDIWRDLSAWGSQGIFDRVPNGMRQLFRYKGRMYFFDQDRNGRRSVIRCLGWSKKPIEKMLEDEYARYKADVARRTVQLYTPANHGYWRNSMQVPVRSLESVEIPYQEKAALLSDIEKYLSGSDWYRRRCVPWRRGYLFHGPPGKGKTSIVRAIAAHFKLPIYAIALSGGLTDGKLQELMRMVDGMNSIVLLEDIDSAGLGRQCKVDDQADKKKDDEGDGKKDKKDNQAVAKKTKESGKKTNVTLSGLLNAIDDVSAPEGQILIMTSNHIEDLDPALTRPGRIDYRLKFDLATKEQAKTIFIRLQKGNEENPEEAETLKSMAQTFADKIPDKTLSPADLQDFLLHRRDEPKKALDEVDKWVEEKLADGEGEEDKISDAGESENGIPDTSAVWPWPWRWLLK